MTENVPSLTLVRTPAEEYADLRARLIEADGEAKLAEADYEKVAPQYYATRRLYYAAQGKADGLRKRLTEMTTGQPVHRQTVAAALRKAGYEMIGRGSWQHGEGFSVGQGSQGAEVSYAVASELRNRANYRDRSSPEAQESVAAAEAEIEQRRAAAFDAYTPVLEAQGWEVRRARHGRTLFVRTRPQYTPPAGGSSSSSTPDPEPEPATV